MRSKLWVLVTLFALIGAACGGSSESSDTPAESETTATTAATTTSAAETTTTVAESTTTAAPESTTTAAAAGVVTVEVLDNNTFDPPEVTINVGDTVSFSKMGGGLHNVNFQDDALPDSGAPTTETFTFDVTFTEPGTYAYICDVHVALGMTGTVVVNP